MPPPPSRRVAIPQAPDNLTEESSSNNKMEPFKSLDRFIVADDQHRNDMSSSSSQYSLLNTTTDTDVILAAWKKEREQQQQEQEGNYRRRLDSDGQLSIRTSPASNVQSRQRPLSLCLVKSTLSGTGTITPRINQ